MAEEKTLTDLKEIFESKTEEEKFVLLCRAGLVRQGRGTLGMLVQTGGEQNLETVEADVLPKGNSFAIYWNGKELSTPTEFMRTVMDSKRGNSGVDAWGVVHDRNCTLQETWSHFVEVYPKMKRFEGGPFRRWFQLSRGNQSNGKWFTGRVTKIKAMPKSETSSRGNVVCMRLFLAVHYPEDSDTGEFSYDQFRQVLKDERNEFGNSLMDAYLGQTSYVSTEPPSPPSPRTTAPTRGRGRGRGRGRERSTPLTLAASSIESDLFRALNAVSDLEEPIATALARRRPLPPPVPFHGGQPRRDGAIASFLSDVADPLLSMTEGGALDGGAWECVADMGGTVAVVERPGGYDVSGAIDHVADMLKSRRGVLPTASAAEVRFLTWRLLQTRMGVGRARLPVKQLGRFLAATRAHAHAFHLASDIWAEWRTWERNNFSADALAHLQERAASGQPLSASRDRSVLKDAHTAAVGMPTVAGAGAGTRGVGEPPVKRFKSEPSSLPVGHSVWAANANAGAIGPLQSRRAAGVFQASLVGEEGAEGWAGAPLPVLVRICSHLTIRDAAAFACVCAPFRCAAAMLGVTGCFAPLALDARLASIATARSAAAVVGRQVESLRREVDLDAIDELDRRNLKTAEDVLEATLDDAMVGRLVRALRNRGRAPQLRASESHLRSLTGRLATRTAEWEPQLASAWARTDRLSAEIRAESSQLMHRVMRQAFEAKLIGGGPSVSRPGDAPAEAMEGGAQSEARH